ncbi:hypothetical protein [Halobacillus halophilus]|uniref:hypothetical protein n=1 Tax=Halobacillus halophilus TaxID=1570 RepID=UPI001CD2B173|nr:hypothetical protein [Halobacillus halophilus]MCA1012637.1 hypothetical protein [Halobacillus halophilus]
MKRAYGVILGQALFVFIYLWIVSYLFQILQVKANEMESFYSYLLFGQIAYIPLGFIMGSGYLIREWKEDGRFKVNPLLIALLVVPALYILSVPYFFPFHSITPALILTNPSAGTVIQIMAGYALVRSIQKKK